MGTNVLREESCNFPGVGQFYNPVIDEVVPEIVITEPPVEPVEPPSPQIPPQPVEPEDQSDQIAQAKWREEVLAWQDEATRVQNEFDVQMEAYRADVALYRAQVEAYQEQALAAERAQVERRIAVESAVLPAEELIRQFEPGFGWTYVDKNDESAYRAMILKTWAAQLAIIIVLFILTMFVQKRKDVVK